MRQAELGEKLAAPKAWRGSWCSKLGFFLTIVVKLLVTNHYVYGSITLPSLILFVVDRTERPRSERKTVSRKNLVQSWERPISGEASNHEKKELTLVCAPFCAGTLLHHIEFWRSLTSDSYILEAIQGYKLELNEIPSQASSFHNGGNSNILITETRKLIGLGVVKKVHPVSDQVVSPVFVVEKRDGSYRMILNLKSLNKSVTYEHFKKF